MGAWIFKKMFGDGMAGVTGLEPAASGVTGQRSNQLSYTPSPMTTGESDVHERSYRLRPRMACVKPNGCPTQRQAHVPHTSLPIRRKMEENGGR